MQGLERERERVAAASRRLAAEGLVLGTAGNVSERAGERVAITPSGAPLETVTAEQVVVVDLDGAPEPEGAAPTSEIKLHLGVYHRYGAGAVVHTHAPFATALACVLDELPVIHYQMLVLGGSVRVAPYATFGSTRLAELTLEALEGRSAALMANHGAIVHAPDLDAAVQQARLLEWACATYWRAASIGAPRTLSEEQLSAVVSAAAERHYPTPFGGDK